jgi:hypothetical protein
MCETGSNLTNPSFAFYRFLFSGRGGRVVTTGHALRLRKTLGVAPINPHRVFWLERIGTLDNAAKKNGKCLEKLESYL